MSYKRTGMILYYDLFMDGDNFDDMIQKAKDWINEKGYSQNEVRLIKNDEAVSVVWK